MSKRFFLNDIGIVSFMAYPQIVSGEGPVLESVTKIASDTFFSLIEITHVSSDEIRNGLKKIIDLSNMRVYFDAHPYMFANKLNINSQNEDERNKSVESLKKLMDEAYFMGTESFVFLSGPKPDDKYFKIEFEKLLISIKELCKYSEDKAKEFLSKPLDIIIETFDDKAFAKNRLIGPTDISVELAEEITKYHKNFGLLLDLSHLTILGEDYYEALNKASKFIKHIHIGNCIISDENHQAYVDEHPRFCIKQGEIFIKELSEFIKILDETGYFDKNTNAISSFEVKPIEKEESDLIIAGSKRALINALKRANFYL